VDLEILTLPTADAATPDVPPASDRLIINVVKADGPGGISRTGVYKLRGRVVANEELKSALRREAQLDWNAEREISNRFVLIRCDKDVPYRYVQDVMMLCCTEPEIRIVKVQIAIKKDE
jgi:biopolymer transport protein ExbD